MISAFHVLCSPLRHRSVTINVLAYLSHLLPEYGAVQNATEVEPTEEEKIKERGVCD